jgi:hypothetical protein
MIIPQEEHDSTVAGHMGQEMIIEHVKRNFFWPHLDQWKEDYVCTCPD